MCQAGKCKLEPVSAQCAYINYQLQKISGECHAVPVPCGSGHCILFEAPDKRFLCAPCIHQLKYGMKKS